MAKRKPARKTYNPDQKRDPGGEGGGQWTADGGDDDGTDGASDEKAYLSEQFESATGKKVKSVEYPEDEVIDIHTEEGETWSFQAGSDDDQYTFTNGDESVDIPLMDDSAEKSVGAKNMATKKKSGAVLFVPLKKIDEEKRLVYGTAAEGDIVDRADEVFDYEGSKPYFEKWSQSVEKASGGKSVGNVRAMHGNTAAGKLTTIAFNDEGKTIDVCAKIVDESEWQKCLEGVYTGFSIGGGYIKKWKDTDGNQRYIADPCEISVVDLPCIPTATFDISKADGSVVHKMFKAAGPKMPSATEIAAKALEMATAAANDSAWVDHIDAARDMLTKEAEEKHSAKQDKKAAKEKGEGEEGFEDEEAANEQSNETDDKGKKKAKDDAGEKDDDAEGDDKAKADKKKKDDEAEKAARNELVQVWKSTDGRTFGKKEDATAHQANINVRKAAHPLTNALNDLKKSLGGEADVPEVPEVFADLSKAAKALRGLAAVSKRDDILAKGMYEVSWFARLLDDMACIQSCVASEAEWEADGSAVPANLKQNIQQLTITFVEMAMEEAAEMVARLKPEDLAELTEAGAGTADAATGNDAGTQQVDPTDDPEVAVHAAEAAKYFADAGKERLEKVGARNSKSDSDRLQKAHDALVELGVMCKAVSTDDDEAQAENAEKLAKAATEVQVITAERDQLKKTLDDAVPQILELKKQVDDLKKQPNPPAPRTHVVEKGADRSGEGNTGDNGQPKINNLHDLLKHYSPEQIQDALIRSSQQRPMSMIDRGQVK